MLTMFIKNDQHQGHRRQNNKSKFKQYFYKLMATKIQKTTFVVTIGSNRHRQAPVFYVCKRGFTSPLQKKRHRIPYCNIIYADKWSQQLKVVLLFIILQLLAQDVYPSSVWAESRFKSIWNHTTTLCFCHYTDLASCIHVLNPVVWARRTET